MCFGYNRQFWRNEQYCLGMTDDWTETFWGLKKQALFANAGEYSLLQWKKQDTTTAVIVEEHHHYKLLQMSKYFI